MAGCGGGASTAEQGATPKSGGTLNAALIADVISIEPTEAIDGPGLQTLSQIVEPLFRTNSEGKVEPWLASSFEKSADQRTWTLHLRRGLEFSTGRPVTADDVVFSLDAVRKSINWTALYEPIEKVEAISPSTVVVKAKRPLPALPSDLSLFAAGIVPDNYGGASKQRFAQHPIGTGPFKLLSWKHGEALTLEKNPRYWRRGEPLLDRVVIHAVPDDNSRVAQLRGGQLDLIYAPPWSQLAGLEAAPGVQVHSYKSAYTDSVILNVRNPLFEDHRVREAVDLAVDRKGIVDAALAGYGEEAGSWLGPAVLHHDASIEPPAQDVAKARKLLSDAIADGANPSFTLLYKAGETYASTASQIIQQNLGEAGFEVDLQPLDESALISQTAAGKFDATLLPWSADVIDPSETVSFYVSTGGFFAGAETTEVSKLVEEAAAETDPSGQRDLYYRIQRLIAKEDNLVALDYQPFVWAARDDVSDVVVTATNYPLLGEVGFTE